MKRDSDGHLARLFAEERVADARRTPAFASVLARPRRAAARRVVAWPVFAASLALMAAAAVWRITSVREESFALRAGDLRVPTDYLLELATFPRAGEIPPIGAVDWFPLDGTDAAPTADTRRDQ